MKPEEIRLGMANHWTTYKKDMQNGKLCKFAQAAFVGEQSEATRYVDGTGAIGMETFEEAWKSVSV